MEAVRKQSKRADHYTAGQEEQDNFIQSVYILFVQVAVKMLLIVCILGNITVFNLLGQQAPSWWTWVYHKQAILVYHDIFSL
jgi:hypothetical protein